MRGRYNTRRPISEEVHRHALRIAMDIKNRKETYRYRKLFRKILTQHEVPLDIPFSKQPQEKMKLVIEETLQKFKAFFPHWNIGMARLAVLLTLQDSGKTIRRKRRNYETTPLSFYRRPPRKIRYAPSTAELEGVVRPSKTPEAAPHRPQRPAQETVRGKQTRNGHASAKKATASEKNWSRFGPVARRRKDTSISRQASSSSEEAQTEKEATVSLEDIDKEIEELEEEIAVSRARRKIPVGRIFTPTPRPNSPQEEEPDLALDEFVQDILQSSIRESERAVDVVQSQAPPSSPPRRQKDDTSIQESSPGDESSEKSSHIQKIKQSPKSDSLMPPPSQARPKLYRPPLIATLRVEFVRAHNDFSLLASFIVSLFKKHTLRTFILSVEDMIQTPINTESSYLMTQPVDDRRVVDTWSLIKDSRSLVELFINEGRGMGVYMCVCDWVSIPS